MVERRTPIPVPEAVSKVLAFANKGEKETISLDDSFGRFLAEDLRADHDVPPFDRSPYDGYAIRASDSEIASQNHPIEFEVIEEIGAGFVATKKVESFQAIRIMTGAQMPTECDAVVMIELTTEYEREGKKYMSIKRPFRSGDNISFQGEDTTKGSVLVGKGVFINPGVKALLATFGYDQVDVAKKPVVGIYATGTELLDVHEELVPGKIRNSNAYMINAQIERAGALPKYFGKLTDDFDVCYEAIKNALDQVDIMITTGGVSVGDYDYLPAIYEKLGAEVLFDKVAMRPGSVTTVAQLNGKLLFGLSGNPSACYVGFELFVKPIVRTMLFSSKPHLMKMKAVLDADFPKPNPFTRFVRSKISFDEGKVRVKPSGLDKSNVVSSLVDANGLMVLPGGTRGFEKGMDVDVLFLEDQEGSQWPWV
ncbi:molybdopterin molybdotransferase MoeA [Ferdinandcohnia quinoae]|uniref:Molybdopterin molybdenumtransferase n=1 Tax=Fredinandcohnia quinoae TaxID=2918902 RepID=A0AAW5E783_9BACI|nr:gephyrin-like molybdotransferase Glp [Fredinandcohnia sp. SECRCQ15]MCH1625866.1 molybdopterin molybdotransferase MoeA [Fredinandcohnia sp. SECRCQ15]